MTALPRIRSGLLKHPLDKQVLVYDTELDRVHLLDPTTACVLELLEEGGHTAEEISAQIVARLDLAPNAGFLPLAIDALNQADLLDSTLPKPDPLIDVNRRELLRTVAMTGAAALLIPAVATFTATRGYAQGTAVAGVGGACSVNANCSSNNCCLGICSNTGCPQAQGASCTANNQCNAAGSCCNNVCSNTLKPTGGVCSAGPGSSCTQQENNANALCCSGTCNGTCTGSGSNRTFSGTCT